MILSRIVTDAEMKEQRKLRAARVEVADKQRIAIGWVKPNLTLYALPDGSPPPKLPKQK